MRTKKTARKSATKSVPKIHHGNKLISRRGMLDRTLARKVKVTRTQQKPARVMPGQTSRPLASMPYFLPVTKGGRYTDLPMAPVRFCSYRTTSTRTVEQAFNFYKDQWNKYVETCSSAARNFISSPKDGERIITITAAADDIRSMYSSWANARQAAVNLFVKISKLPLKKQFEWVRKSLGLEMVQILRLTSEKVVMDVYLGLKKVLFKK
jgi:hypothetical protein